jgi:D-ribose pyranase
LGEKSVLRNGILNPAINSLLSRVRHTNTLVLADRGFPYWPGIETIDISLVDDIPRVLDVLDAIRRNFTIGRAFMAEEFQSAADAQVSLDFTRGLEGITVLFESHDDFRQRVPHAVGIIRTADTTSYANLILESA